MGRYQIIEFLDYYEGVENFIVLFCKNEASENETIYVKNCPLTLCVAVGEDYDGMDHLVCSLNEHLLKRPPKCNALGCSCGGDEYGIYRYPCLKKRRYLQEAPVVKSQIIRRRGFDMYEEGDRPFVEVTLNKSFYLQAAATFLSKFDVGKVDPRFAGVYDKTANGVDEFILSKRVASFDWIEIPDGGDGYVEYEDVKVVTKEMVGVESKIVKCYLDIETVKLTATEQFSDIKTRNADYLVGVVCTTLVLGDGTRKNQSWMLKARDIDDFEDSETRFFEDEGEMLNDMRRYFLAENIDIFLGYYSNKFDFPYLINRARRLGVDEFEYFSRLPYEPIVFRESVVTSKQTGTKTKVVFNCPGRIFLDLAPMVERSYRFDSYKLKDVAKELDMNVMKDDMDYENIHGCFFGDSQTRAKLLAYCKQDVVVTVDLGEAKLDVVRRLIATSRLYGVNAQQVPDRGNSYLLGMMLRREMGDEYLPNTAKFDEALRASFASIEGYPELWANALAGEKYPGAFVLDPKTGLWNCCVLTFDFNSLYPSIMITFNICLTTQVAVADKTNPDLNVAPSGFAYVKEHVKKGLLPALLERLIDERTAVRGKMKTETDASRVAMMDAEQNALKIGANSLYGLMGSLKSIMTSISAAYSVTSYGRYYIQMTCDALMEIPNFETKYGRTVEKPGFVEEFGLEILYGDTDSLFIALKKIQDPVLAMTEIGPKILAWVNKGAGLLLGRLKMGLEDCSYPFYLLAKKKYVKVIFDQKKNALKFKLSGLGNRSLTPYNSDLMKQIIDLKFREKRPQEYIEGFIIEACRRVWADEVPKSMLRHSTKFSRELEDYDTTGAHITAAHQLKEAGYPVNPGDRITYFYCHVATTSKTKTGLTVAAELLTPDHVLHKETYIKEIVDNLMATVSLFVSGNSPAQRKKRIEYLAYVCRETFTGKLIRAPSSIKHAAMDSFLGKSEEEEKKARPTVRQDVDEEKTWSKIDDESIRKRIKLANPLSKRLVKEESLPMHTPADHVPNSKKARVKQTTLGNLFKRI